MYTKFFQKTKKWRSCCPSARKYLTAKSNLKCCGTNPAKNSTIETLEKGVKHV